MKPPWDGLLRRIIDLTGEDLGLADLVDHVASLVVDATGADVCFVHLVDEERRCLVLAGATPPFNALAGTIELAIGEGVAGWVAQHGEPAIVPDKWKDARYKYIPALRGEEYDSLVSVPMIRRGRHVVGVLNVHSRERWDCTEEELAVLTDVAGLLAGVVENGRLRQRLADREAELEQFARRMIELQELERRRIAGDIHDGISQRLISLWYHLAAAGAARPDEYDVVSGEIERCQELVTAALDEARRAILGLRPAVLDDLGLGPGLESLAHGLPGITAEVDVEDDVQVPPHIETALFRIAQEALQNVAKHSGAANVQVSLSKLSGAVRLEVVDDGQGFDPAEVRRRTAAHSYGLAGMHERVALLGGAVRIVSRPGEGTTVVVDVPVD